MLGISRDPTDWDTVTTADVDRIIRSGRRRFFSANAWKFLKENYIINTLAPITVDKVSITNGVVTLVTIIGSTWPATTANFLLSVDGGLYKIASRDTDTQVTLEDTTVTAVVLADYSLYQYKFDLPSNFGGWEGPIVIENYNGRKLNESRNFPEYVLRVFANRNTVRTGIPEMFTLISTTDSETAIATHQLQLYPLPDAIYVLSTRIRISAGDTLDLANTVVSSDPVFTECYKESVLAAGEVIAFGQPGSHSQRFLELVREAVRQDNAMSGIRFGRPRNQTQGRSRYYDLITGTVDMSGQE